jgi:hypothetical protein
MFHNMPYFDIYCLIPDCFTLQAGDLLHPTFFFASLTPDDFILVDGEAVQLNELTKNSDNVSS